MEYRPINSFNAPQACLHLDQPYAEQLAHYMASLDPFARSQLVQAEGSPTDTPIHRPVQMFEALDMPPPYDVTLSLDITNISLHIQNQAGESNVYNVPVVDFLSLMDRFIKAEGERSLAISPETTAACKAVCEEGGKKLQSRLRQEGFSADLDMASNLFATAALIGAQIKDRHISRHSGTDAIGRA